MLYVKRKYFNGEGVTKDETKSFQWDTKSAPTGSIEAMFNIGEDYENGIEVNKDKKEAFKWYPKAAEKGHDMSQCAPIQTWGMLNEGYGTNKGIVKSIYWLNKAKENGNTDELLEEILINGINKSIQIMSTKGGFGAIYYKWRILSSLREVVLKVQRLADE
ncbi:hypothetical protein Glove_233g38 [Diversispora epigaea]|uniref:Uncharacterized protein n=1 Tax=Diversispora epigaea TaxID=1348612 RepID=A0A397IB10_9GLOM|nr:hypothetical protein Glove_233g38 [Diversispora epigaea]